MCGIAGILHPTANPGATDDARSIQTMLDVIAHRGPDEQGIHVEPRVALGHKRLSIIDLATGRQPLFNEDGSVCVVFNGEIYNFQELTAELVAQGHRFQTHSDTEVIVHAWENWGERCVERFRGMFAFALWDRNSQTLFLARDRLGVKPLYYGFLNDGRFVFGSELKCLTVLPEFRRTLDEQAIEEYFALGYVPDPRTIYTTASKLAPGHSLVIRSGSRQASPRRYWDLAFEPNHSIRPDDAARELSARIEEAVRIRMIADVPLGAFLSGGVDSSVVVAAMVGASSAPVSTFAIGFDNPRFDESGFAAQVSTLLATDHHQRIVAVDDTHLLTGYARLFDEPFADSSALPTFQVSSLARERVKVALSGDGGDETFGGYRRYQMHLAEETARRLLPLRVRRAVGIIGDHFPKLDFLPRPLRAKTTLQAIGRSAVQAYYSNVSFIAEAERLAMYSPAFRQRLGGYRACEVFEQHARRAHADDPLSLMQYLDYNTYLPGDINTKVDRASMANSLEVRDPLMDHLLLEWAATLPASMKIRDGKTKWVLKQAAAKWLPNEILHRRKMGFSMPLRSWIQGPLREPVRSMMHDGAAAASGHLNPARLRTMYDEHLHGKRDWSTAIWSIYAFHQFLSQNNASG
ncbi:MAG: amidotransferase 1, exosortase A system-associated [Burkholderiaceae bacterium]